MIIGVISCKNSEKKSFEETEGSCLSKLKIFLNLDTENKNKSIKYDRRKEEFLFLKKSAIYKYNCSDASIDSLVIGEISIDSFDPKISILKSGFYIYHSLEHFIAIDNDFNIKYSSHEFINQLTEEDKFGLAGITVGFSEISSNLIIVSYKLGSDVGGFLPKVINDTLDINNISN